MTLTQQVRRLRRVGRKPPRYVAARLLQEARFRSERLLAPRRVRRFDERALLATLGAETVDEAWETLASRPYVAQTRMNVAELERIAPGSVACIETAAALAAERRIDLLGTGPFTLVDWHTDVKTGTRWDRAWFRSIEYAQLGRPSDVKVPWEISRLQWALPLAQLHALRGGEHEAEMARELLTDWIDENPYAGSVNWASPMEAAIRIFTWTYFFHCFARSAAWSGAPFRSTFLRSLYLHADFVARNLEESDINGNHFDADAAGLVFAGCFFGPPAQRWQDKGWSILSVELGRQTSSDGVDFEGSTAYHRLVTELFLLPALYRERVGLPVPADYRRRVSAMAEFAATYTRDDGTSPLLGDADDARVLPLGTQPLLDHRYLASLAGSGWGLCSPANGPRDEVAWILGVPAASALAPAPRTSRVFRDGGYAVLRNEADHVFVDCAPVGLGGRGGHGHNDCLSIELTLAGTPLVVDSGSYVYTASVEQRNAFRRTDAHSTVQVDGAELNRMPAGDELWSLAYDAVPTQERWEENDTRVVFGGRHSGYERLRSPITVARTVALSLRASEVAILDEIRGVGNTDIVVPFHLAPDVVCEEAAPGCWRLVNGQDRFTFAFDPSTVDGTRTRISWTAPSYGVKVPRTCLELVTSGAPKRLLTAFATGDGNAEELLARAQDLVH